MSRVTWPLFVRGGGALMDFAYGFEISNFTKCFSAIDLLIDFGDITLRYRFAYRFWRNDSAL